MGGIWTDATTGGLGRKCYYYGARYDNLQYSTANTCGSPDTYMSKQQSAVCGEWSWKTPAGRSGVP